MSWKIIPKIIDASKYVPVTDPDLKKLYDYFNLKRSYLWDELGHRSWNSIEPENEIIQFHIETIEKLQKELDKLRKND